MDLKGIRDQLILKKGAYNEAIKNTAIAIDEASNIISSLTADEYLIMGNLGIDYSPIQEIDFERLKTDKDYLEALKTSVIKITDVLSKELEKSLCIE